MKGKVFGKLNIFDLVVIAIVVVALLVAGIKLLGNSGEETEEEISVGATLTYTVRVTAQKSAVAEQIGQYVNTATGTKDQLMAGSSLYDAYVVDYWTEETTYNRIADSSVTMIDAQEAAEADLVDIVFVIEAQVEDITTNTVGTQEVRLGKSHTVKTIHFEFIGGFVESCTWSVE